VKISQLGTPLFDARRELLTLWALAILYGGLALGLNFKDQRLLWPSVALA